MGACQGRASDLGPIGSSLAYEPDSADENATAEEIARREAELSRRQMVQIYLRAANQLRATNGQKAISDNLDDFVTGTINQASSSAQIQGRSCVALEFRQRRDTIGEYGSQAIAQLVHDGCDIQDLILSDCGVTHVAALLIGKGLRRNEVLLALDLSHNVLGARGVCGITRYIRGNATLTRLNLCNTSIDETCAQALCNGLLLSANVIEELNLSHNSLNDRALEGLARALACNYRLRRLNVEGNGGPSPLVRSQRLQRRISDSSVNSSNSNGGAGPSGNNEPENVSSQFWTADESVARINRYLERNDVVAQVLDDFITNLELPEHPGSRQTAPQMGDQLGDLGNLVDTVSSRSRGILRTLGSSMQILRRGNGASAGNSSELILEEPNAEGSPSSHGDFSVSATDGEDEPDHAGIFFASDTAGGVGGLNGSAPGRSSSNGGAAGSTGRSTSSSSSVAGDVVGGTGTGARGTASNHSIAGFGKRSSSDDSHKSFGWLRPDQQSGTATKEAGPPAPGTPPAALLSFADSSRIRFGFAETRGRRNNMEDVVLMRQAFGPRRSDFLFGVFDGHGGVETAKFAHMWLPEIFQGELAAALDAHEAANRDATVTMCMARAFRGVQEKCRTLKINNGSCAVLAYVSGRDLYVANLGDSRALLVNPDQSTRQLGRVISPLDRDERNRIESCGGFVTSKGRVLGQIAVSRALGDIDHQPFVSAEPTFAVHHFELLSSPPRYDAQRYAWLILGCDGVWDVLDQQVVARKLKYVSDPSRAAHKIRSCAFRRGSHDNISVVCVRFDLSAPSATPISAMAPAPRD